MMSTMKGLQEDRKMKVGLRGLMAQFQMQTNFAAVKRNRRERRKTKQH